MTKTETPSSHMFLTPFVQLSCLFLIFMILLTLFGLLTVPPKLQITACDVGQGDAVLMQYGQSFVLFDTGPNSSVLRCLQAEISFLDPTLDLVVLSHPDKDHIGGWETVQEHYRVRELWTNGQADNPSSTNSVVRVPQMADVLRWPGGMLTVVWNGELYDLWEGAIAPEENKNSRSVGTYVTSAGFGFLSLGDLECREELAVTTLGLLNTTTILKTSHHGSKTSTCSDFLEKIQTETAFVSVGEKNSYGHPEENVLKTLQNHGILVYRTDLQGKITFLWEPLYGLFVEPEALSRH